MFRGVEAVYLIEDILIATPIMLLSQPNIFYISISTDDFEGS